MTLVTFFSFVHLVFGKVNMEKPYLCGARRHFIFENENILTLLNEVFNKGL